VFLVETPGFDTLVVPGRINQRARGPYGATLVIPPLGGLRPVTRLFYKTLDLTKTTTSPGKRVETHFIEAPTTCDGSWRFEAQLPFRSGEAITAPAAVPCTP
jgi:hypothetical protein